MNFIKKLQSILYKAFKFVFSSKTLLIIVIYFIYLKLKKFPLRISTFEFLKILHEKLSYIRKLMILDGATLLFKLNGKNMICNYIPESREQFTTFLLQNNIKFDYFYGLESFVINPYNNLMCLSSICSVLFLTQFDIQKKFTFNFPIFKFFQKNFFRISNENNENEDVLNDFIANEDIKIRVRLILDQIKNPQKYKEKNIKIITGCLLYGQAGTGKTLLARCLSKVQGIKFINTCASDFVEIFVGSGAKRIREIFQLARENRPAIIFIDEIEALGFRRPADVSLYSLNVERFSTLNQLLSEMDGLLSNDNILVLGATNRQELLDSALIRPGRFDIKIGLNRPDKKLRFDIFKLYLKKYKYDVSSLDDATIEKYAILSEGLTGACIEYIVNDAATISFSNNNSIIGINELDESFNKNLSEFKIFQQYEIDNSLKI